jgi:hypothetical protein
VKQTRLKQKPAIALITGCFFVLLLASSAPHRVHHVFDDLCLSEKNTADAGSKGQTHPDGHSDHDHDCHNHGSGGSAKADCVTQAVAQNVHLASAEATEVGYLEVESENRPPVTLTQHFRFSLSPFSQRAPPRA